MWAVCKIGHHALCHGGEGPSVSGSIISLTLPPGLSCPTNSSLSSLWLFVPSALFWTTCFLDRHAICPGLGFHFCLNVSSQRLFFSGLSVTCGHLGHVIYHIPLIAQTSESCLCLLLLEECRRRYGGPWSCQLQSSFTPSPTLPKQSDSTHGWPASQQSPSGKISWPGGPQVLHCSAHPFSAWWRCHWRPCTDTIRSGGVV